MQESPFSAEVVPDWEGLLRCIKRQGTPQRVHFIELFLDAEVQVHICERYRVLDGLDGDDPFFEHKRLTVLQRFLGYDHVSCGLEGLEMPSLRQVTTDDTAPLRRQDGRHYLEEHEGPIKSWDEFEAYPWPDPESASTRSLEWYQANLPDDMCIIGGLLGHFYEYLSALMGYETLCYALYDRRDLVAAISDRLLEIDRAVAGRLLEFDRVKFVWGSDDMGFRTGTLIGPDDLREFVLPGHRMVAEMAHDAGRPYLLHSCGNLDQIMPDLLDDVRIDALHSFEDTIETVTSAKERFGDRIALLGGIDVDFLCRASREQIARRVRETLEECLPGGGYCLGTGNSVTNYIPVDNYLTMLDEGRKFTP